MSDEYRDLEYITSARTFNDVLTPETLERLFDMMASVSMPFFYCARGVEEIAAFMVNLGGRMWYVVSEGMLKATIREYPITAPPVDPLVLTVAGIRVRYLEREDTLYDLIAAMLRDDAARRTRA